MGVFGGPPGLQATGSPCLRARRWLRRWAPSGSQQPPAVARRVWLRLMRGKDGRVGLHNQNSC